MVSGLPPKQVPYDLFFIHYSDTEFCMLQKKAANIDTTNLLQLSLIQPLARRFPKRHLQCSGCFEFPEHLIPHLNDSFPIGRNIDQVVPFNRVIIQIVERVDIPNAVMIDILIPIGPYRKQGRRRGKIPLPMILI